MARHRYLIALGSNKRHHKFGRPRQVMGQAMIELDQAGVRALKVGPLVFSDPLGPSYRKYANSVAVVGTSLEPEELLGLIKRIERQFGRRPGGQRWGSRVIDLDIVLWDGGPFVSKGLVIPHPRFRTRAFVLGPAAEAAPDWRDPVSGLTLRQLNARLTARRPLRR
ncbi:MAG TPA: 2-amino-4-hydroxy-6-hydroxymethyldihydropteridine diphosphokinase [Sphingomonadaceae bacterium]|nr:2-amino-4-hydroxy-6-hydroxymethyldihydropteridine diphosphokinase [Sphingomonadaceae bacterium]